MRERTNRIPASRPALRVLRAAVFLLGIACSFPRIPEAFPQNTVSGPERDTPLRVRALVREKYPLLQVVDKTRNRPEGMAIDALDAVGKAQGISITWVFLPPAADVAEALRQGRGDIAADWGDTMERSKEFVFSASYITLPVNVYMRKGSNAVRDARLLGGRKVGVVRRNVADEILSSRTDLRIERYDGIHDALFHLLAGEIDAVAHLGPILFEEARRAGIDDKIELVEPALAESPRSFAARKKDAEVIRLLNTGLKEWVGSAAYRRTYLKWFGPPAPFWTWRRIVAVNAAGAVALVTVLGVWHYLSLLRVNRALAESRTRFQSLVETIADVVWEIDRVGNLTYIGPNVLAILGYTPEELAGRSAFSFMVPESASYARRNLETSLGNRKPFFFVENVYLHKSGRQVVAETTGAPFVGRNGDVLGFRGVFRDITERKRIEAEARRIDSERATAQKYESVGNLAAGMAHHINNLMTIVCGYSSILLGRMHPSGPGRKEIGEIRKAGERAAALTAQLLAFSRKSILQPVACPIDDLVAEAAPALRDLPGAGVDLSIVGNAGDALVCVDARQFASMLKELARNASDAMPEGGRLVVATGTREIRDSAVQELGLTAPGMFATVSVTDTGLGMSPEVLPHLYEPFYTTKGFGRGMGLPSIFGFVKQCDGFIDVESRPNAGTTVTVGFPVFTETAPAP